MTAAPLALVLGSFLCGQQPATPGPAPPSSRSAKAVEAFRAEVAEYDVRLGSRPGEKLVLEKEAALRWDNPARTGEDGALFIWTLGGRPEMIGTVFTYRYKETLSRKHEYHSLATGPLTAQFRGKQVWAPTKAGVTFQPVNSAPPPADNPRQRLTQMKALAREFAASMIDERGESYQLRLLSQPLLRYEPQDKQIQDGSLFAFSLGTDPEVILLLESRMQKDAFVWEYALARFHYIELKVSHQGREIWRVPALPDIMNLDIGQPKYQDSVYATYHVERNIPVPGETPR